LLKNYYLLLFYLTTISFVVNLSFHSFVGDFLWLKAKAVPPYVDVPEECFSHHAERTKYRQQDHPIIQFSKINRFLKTTEVNNIY